MLRAQTYRALANRLKSSMPSLQFIDLQKGQMEREDSSYPLPFPAVLIEFLPVQWGSSGDPQMGNTLIRIHAYDDHLGDTFEGGEQEYDSVKDLNLIDELFHAMQGFATESMSPLNRAEDQVSFDGRYVKIRIDFECNLYQERRKQEFAPLSDVELKVKRND